MSQFDPSSLKHRATLHPDLQRLCDEIIKTRDISIICGFRNEADQNAAFADGRSMLKWPRGLHNKNPSLAVDLAPYPTNWADDAEFIELAGLVKATAARIGVKIQWGGDWNGFKDLDHFQLV